jgi:excisionase family DNA binding protein
VLEKLEMLARLDGSTHIGKFIFSVSGFFNGLVIEVDLKKCKLLKNRSNRGICMEPILLTEQQAAQVLTVKEKTLQAWRVRGGGPKFVKLGRCVRYRREDLDKFLDERTMTHTQAR